MGTWLWEIPFCMSGILCMWHYKLLVVMCCESGSVTPLLFTGKGWIHKAEPQGSQIWRKMKRLLLHQYWQKNHKKACNGCIHFGQIRSSPAVPFNPIPSLRMLHDVTQSIFPIYWCDVTQHSAGVPFCASSSGTKCLQLNDLGLLRLTLRSFLGGTRTGKSFQIPQQGKD